MMMRMLWNPRWNESLFLTSCAERILENPTLHSEDEILNRIMRDILGNNAGTQVNTATHMQFRLLVIQRHGSQLQHTIAFHSRIQTLPTRNVA